MVGVGNNLIGQGIGTGKNVLNGIADNLIKDTEIKDFTK